MKTELKNFFRNTFNFNGYATKSEFFSVLLVSFAIGAFSALDSVVPGLEYVFALLTLIWLIPLISLVMRRFHAVGVNTGIAVLLMALPIVFYWFPVALLWKELLEAVCTVSILGIGLFKSSKTVNFK